MHWFTEQDSKLVVKELPLGKWIMGFFFFLMFALTVLISFFDKNSTVAAFFTFPFVLACLYMLYTSPFITVSIDRFRETVAVEKQTLFNYKIFTVKFQDLNGLLSVSEKNSGKLTTYYIKIPLRNNPKMEKLIELETSNHNFHKAVSRINDYLQKPGNKSLPGSNRKS